jgi:hypothetical protein
MTPPDPLPENSIPSLCNLQGEFYQVTISEVTTTVNRAKIDTATGPDKTSYSTIRNLHFTSSPTPPALFSAPFHYQTIPKE